MGFKVQWIFDVTQACTNICQSMCLCQQNSTNAFGLVAIFVGLKVCKDTMRLDNVVNHRRIIFKMTKREANCYMGLHIYWNQQMKSIYIEYIICILKKFGFKYSHPMVTQWTWMFICERAFQKIMWSQLFIPWYCGKHHVCNASLQCLLY
jgi:hypothetical protein